MERISMVRNGLSAATPTSTPPELIKVFLRLRPKNKLEMMKRGKDCIELHEDPRKITVDSPRLGHHKFSFDQVFDEFSTQEEVYRECVSAIPAKLLRGIDSTLIAYGQSGSGKTHTLLGEGLGAELAALVNNPPPSDDYESSLVEHQGQGNMHRKNLDPKRHPNVTAGVIPRVVADIFDLLYESASNERSMEFTIRCSYVEIYLDRINDLLRPSIQDQESTIRVGQSGLGKEVSILGATELCCVCPEDVYATLARGQALRTKSSKDRGIDSSRSHAIFTFHLERADKVTGELSRSRLQVFDLAGSQSGHNKSTTTQEVAMDAERRLMNASLASFHKLVQRTLQHQQQQRKSRQASYSKPAVPSQMSKIAKILEPSIGGKTYTTMICTGSPSSFSIDETIQTISFAQLVHKIINTPQVSYQGYTLHGYQRQLAMAEQREQQLTRFVNLVAQECKYGKKKSREPKNPKVWDAVLQICDEDDGVNDIQDNGDGRDNKLCISVYEEGEKEKEVRHLRAKLAAVENKLRYERIAREKAESACMDARSDLVAQKAQHESFEKYKRKMEEELTKAKAETQEVMTQKAEVEHKLRTSEFRESEAIVFLRQFRTFYFRLLRNKAAHGSGNTRDVIDEAKHKIPGAAPDLEDLLDVDRMMVKSGIIESSEIGADTPTADYTPSNDAYSKSSLEAKRAKDREALLIQKELGSTIDELDRGQLIACRQKLLSSPAGVLAIQRENELEKNLHDLSEKCVGLQNSLSSEKAMVQALSGRQGAMTKMKQMQETIILKTELERRTNDLHAIVWKMNELHLVNKTISSKAISRDHHSSYLSEYVSDMQTKNQRRLAEIEREESRLRLENSRLQNQLDDVSLDLWQLGEHLEKAPIWRCSVPYSCEFLDSVEENSTCNISTGNLTEEDIDGLIEIIRCND